MSATVLYNTRFPSHKFPTHRIMKMGVQVTSLSIFLILSMSSIIMEISCATTVKQQQTPFSPRASLLRHWNHQIANNLQQIPPFLLSKSSPLNAVDSAILTKLAAEHSLSAHLTSFCSKANLFCSFDAPQPIINSETSSNHDKDANFATYTSQRFSFYGAARLKGRDSFKNYSDDRVNTASDSFIRYSRDSTAHSEAFNSYANDANLGNENFGNYASGSTGGSGTFAHYGDRDNLPGIQFTTYDSDANNHKLSFATYSKSTNVGSETFSSYGKRGNGIPSEFISYSDDYSNLIDSKFTNYGVFGNAANDSFAGYGKSGNNPENDFKIYGAGGNSGVDSFSNYRESANQGEDSFRSYAENSNSGKANFRDYGKTFNQGNDTFKGYGIGSKGVTSFGFKNYTFDRSFEAYKKDKATLLKFAEYNNSATSANKIWVEPGKFFRESMLTQGNIMPMPDITDKMPARSFLPRSLLSKLPFSTTRIAEVKEIFHAPQHSSTEHVVTNAVKECERDPSQGETKKCVGSIEDMVDFAVKVLGHNVVVRTTENVSGSGKDVMIGAVRGINGGEVTKSVSCHQSLYPYLLYYCHSVPKVRVYEADIVDVESRAKINVGVAICHIDTSTWGPDHGAFVALGSSPGKIEVCHWIFENDMTWTIAD